MRDDVCVLILLVVVGFEQPGKGVLFLYWKEIWIWKTDVDQYGYNG